MKIIHTAVLAALLVPAAQADCKIEWAANPAEENVSQYRVYVDGKELITANTSALCSDFSPPIDESTARHEAWVVAENSFGLSGESARVPFGSPTSPASVSVKKE